MLLFLHLSRTARKRAASSGQCNYRLAAGLTRLSQLAFPVSLNDTTRIYFEKTAQMEGVQLGEDLRAFDRGNAYLDRLVKMLAGGAR